MAKPAVPDAAGTWIDPLAQLESDQGLPFDQFVTFKVNQLSMAFERQWTRFMRDKAGVSLSEWRILATLAGQGPLSFARLVDATGINKSLCSRSTRVLQDNALIVASETPGDARSITLELTASGRRLVAQMRPLALQRQRLLLQALTTAERRALYASIGKLQMAAHGWEADH